MIINEYILYIYIFNPWIKYIYNIYLFIIIIIIIIALIIDIEHSPYYIALSLTHNHIVIY